MDANYLLIVKVPKGIVIRDTPRPQSEGGLPMRSVPVGKSLYAYNIINIQGVEYARLVPQNPLKPEWIRVKEADGSIEYVEVIDISKSNEDMLAKSIRESGSAINAGLVLLATAIRELARK